MYNPATQVQVPTGANLGSYYFKKNSLWGVSLTVFLQKKYLLEHENDMHMEERDEIDKIVLEQYPILKNNLPVEVLGDPPPTKG